MDNGFYGKVNLNPKTLANMAASDEIWSEILSFNSQLASDEYVSYLDKWYRECHSRFGRHWYYLDIVNVLYGASKAVKPKNYLEIGVRRGRSVCMVAKATPTVNIFAFDMWKANYAGMDNPGPDFVRSELSRMGHRGQVQFVNGNSHETLKRFFLDNPTLTFDMMTVDGDHSEVGAAQDLNDVIPHLSVGGILVFDDISHPSHPYLLNLWKKTIAAHPGLVSYEFTEMGYGVAFAIRMR
ncbi:MAG: hypothetical protein A2293_07230 [Elusimicrobia bacterium RIFOXYB2_FULL_49_7]|nr:MAG: hypothetical protein A2293_07230 [Elusimicrobia bacterium RIFOXYB2_FULL_49_7]